MKYIRTKRHGVCKVIKEGKYTISYENKYVVGCMDKDANKMQQADTIPELCDEIIIKYKDEPHPRAQDMQELLDSLKEAGIPFMPHFKYLIESYDGDIEFIKLGIWTDKGLIYVAEFDEKGELELL